MVPDADPSASNAEPILVFIMAIQCEPSHRESEKPMTSSLPGDYGTQVPRGWQNIRSNLQAAAGVPEMGNGVNASDPESGLMQKILVIEDERPLRKMVATALTAAGYRVVEASNGVEGVERAFAELPDLIVSDIQMPKMDGLAVLTWLRNDPVTAGIPVILTTGYAKKVPMRLGMSCGADDYLPKPFKIDEVLAAVKTRLQKNEQAEQAAEMKLLELRTLLCSSLSNELLAPFAKILGRTEIVRCDIGSMKTAEILENVNTIDRSATQLHRLIQHYLLLSEVKLLATDPAKVSEMRARSTPYSRDVIIGWAAAVAKRLNRSEDLNLKVDDIAAPLGQDHLKKITEELVEHAFKFSRPGTPVRVETCCSGGYFQLSVHDLGRGFDFDQNPQKSGGSEDSNLGMTIARSIVELHGGTLVIETQTGTKAEIRIPED